MHKTKRRMVSIIMAVVLTMTMAFAMTTTAFATTSEDNIKVYVTVERSLLGNQDPILEPKAVTVPVGSSVIDVLNKVKQEVTGFDFTHSGSVASDTAYISAFKVASHGSFNYLTDYEFWGQYNTAAGGMGSMYFDYGAIPSSTDMYLTAGDYNMLGGWIFSANDNITWDDDGTTVNEAYPTASTTLTASDDNIVLRFHYSMALARDAGYAGFSLLDMTTIEPAFYTKADKDQLVRNMADYTGSKTSNAYTNGLTVLKDMDATQSEVDNAVGQL